MGDDGFDEIDRQHYAFAWRSVRRLGVRDAEVDDVVQDVFVVVNRRFPDFQGRSSIETWRLPITFRVVRDHRRSAVARAQREAPVSAGRPTTEPDRKGLPWKG